MARTEVLVRFNFYRVATGDSPLSLSDALRSLVERDPSDRVVEVGPAHVMLHSLSKREPWVGHLVRIRMKPLPSRASIKGALSDLELQDDEGLGEHTVFYYDDDTNVLVMSSTQYGVTDATFCQYLASATDLNVSLQYVPDLKGLDDVEGLSRITKFELSLAGFKNPVKVEGAHGFVEAVFAAQSAMQAPVVSMQFSVGTNWRNSSLNPGLVKRAVKALYNSTQEIEVRTLKVDGRTTHEERAIIDLMKGKLVAEVAIKGDERRVSMHASASAARVAWELYADTLREMYLEDGDDT